MAGEKVLVSGAGIAGSILAYWLGKAEFQVTVIERSRSGLKLGQGLEIENPAIKVIKAMGIHEQLKEIKTSETGSIVVDEHSRPCATFTAVGGINPTGDLEIMRGDLTEVLYKTADAFPNVSYRFNTTIESMRQTSDKVIVDLQERGTEKPTTEEFDFVVGADGVKSRTRNLALGSDEQLECMHPIEAFNAYFDIPKLPQDEHNARICMFPGSRIVWLRPVQPGSDRVTAYLVHCRPNVASLQAANASGDRQKQKEAFAELFSGLGWEVPRVIEGMMGADNFYSDELKQVKLKNWSSGRVTLVGDAAWAPTPFTGQGNQLAIIGAFVLAQEMSRNRTAAAFDSYQKRLKPYVDEQQQIPIFGRAGKIFNPEKSWQIWLLRRAIGLMAVLARWWPKGLVEDTEGNSGFDLEIDHLLKGEH